MRYYKSLNKPNRPRTYENKPFNIQNPDQIAATEIRQEETQKENIMTALKIGGSLAIVSAVLYFA